MVFVFADGSIDTVRIEMGGIFYGKPNISIDPGTRIPAGIGALVYDAHDDLVFARFYVRCNIKGKAGITIFPGKDFLPV